MRLLNFKHLHLYHYGNKKTIILLQYYVISVILLFQR